MNTRKGRTHLLGTPHRPRHAGHATPALAMVTITSFGGALAGFHMASVRAPAGADEHGYAPLVRELFDVHLSPLAPPGRPQHPCVSCELAGHRVMNCFLCRYTSLEALRQDLKVLLECMARANGAYTAETHGLVDNYVEGLQVHHEDAGQPADVHMG